MKEIYLSLCESRTKDKKLSVVSINNLIGGYSNTPSHKSRE